MIEMCCLDGICLLFAKEPEKVHHETRLTSSVGQTKGNMIMAAEPRSLQNWNKYGKLLVFNTEF